LPSKNNEMSSSVRISKPDFLAGHLVVADEEDAGGLLGFARTALHRIQQAGLDRQLHRAFLASRQAEQRQKQRHQEDEVGHAVEHERRHREADERDGHVLLDAQEVARLAEYAPRVPYEVLLRQLVAVAYPSRPL
jgi:hypothetical protein